MDAECFEPAGAWHACDGRRPPHARPDQGPTRGDIHHLARADAEHGVHVGLDEAGEMRGGASPPLGHAHITRCSQGVHLLHLGEIVGEKGRDDQRQEHPGARMEEPSPSCHGNATPGPRCRRLPARLLQGRRVRHRAPRAIDHTRTMARPPAFVQGGSLHRSSKALEAESEEAPRECGTGLTGCCRAEPHARHMGPMATGGVAVQTLSQE